MNPRQSNMGPRPSGVRVLVSPYAAAMRAFDMLPARLRRVLNYAPIDLAPQSVLAHLRKGRAPLLLVTSIKAMAADQFTAQRQALKGLRRERAA